MAWLPLAELVLATGGQDISQNEAELEGFGLYQGTGHWWPQLRRGEGRVRGALMHCVPDAAMDRLRFFAGGMRATLAPVDLHIEGQVAQALSLIPDSSEPESEVENHWHLPDWQKRWGQLTLWATQEAMDYFGRFSAAELKARMPMIAMRAGARAAAAQGVAAQLRSPMRADEVRVISQSAPHAGFFVTRDFTLRHPGFDGEMSADLRREVFVATDAAIVLPYDPARDRVLLVEQFRMGPYGRGDPRPWMLEPVAGRVDPGEAPEDTARRECVEEAGIALEKLEHIASYYCSPGCSTEYFHCYLGICDLPDLAQGQGGLALEHEDIRTHVLPFERAMDLISSGEADNGPLILSLIWLAQQRDRLRAGA